MTTLLKLILLVLLISTTACNDSKRDDNPNPNPNPKPKPDPDPNPYTPPDSNLSLFKEPYFKYAWHFSHNENFANTYNINKDANIHIKEAWTITQGEDINIAVIDAGAFDENHEDLSANVVNVFNADNNNENVQGDGDEAYHGTTVAGFIASPANGIGLVGAAPKARLILIKQSRDEDAATIRAFKYARDNGANVINCSWGTYDVSQIVATYIQELSDEGITIIFASGNEGCNLDENFYLGNDGFPRCSKDSGKQINDESELPSVIGISASDESNDIASYTNYGSNIDLLAPGGDNQASIGLLGLDNIGIGGRSTQRALVTNNYAFTNGTSFAAPITAGVAALMLSVNPTLTSTQIRQILINTSDRIGLNTNYNASGFDKFRAYGKINATKAVKAARDF